MPVPQGSALPPEAPYVPLPADVYEVKIDDIEEEIKPSPFKKPDGTPEEDSHQYKLKLAIQDEPFVGKFITCWVRASLRPAGKSKYPTLPQLLLAVTGKEFGLDDREKVNGEFLNTLIGSQLRITTINEAGKQDPSKSFPRVTSFLATKQAKTA
jgi:hypothetical protein